MEKKIIAKNDRVTFMVKNVFINEVEAKTFTERYAVLLRSRWSLLYMFFKDYAIENGQRGCYIGEKQDRDGYYYDIWDLSKIFPDVSFKENDYSNLKVIP